MIKVRDSLAHRTLHGGRRQLIMLTHRIRGFVSLRVQRDIQPLSRLNLRCHEGLDDEFKPAPSFA
jgi:hypothetical protein